MKNEKLTRKEIIDHRLQEAGWNVADRTQVIEEFDIDLSGWDDLMMPYAGHQYSDYVLLGKDNKPLAVVEARKMSIPEQIEPPIPEQTEPLLKRDLIAILSKKIQVNIPVETEPPIPKKIPVQIPEHH